MFKAETQNTQRRIAKAKVYGKRKSLAIEGNGLYDFGELLKFSKNSDSIFILSFSFSLSQANQKPPKIQ